MCWATHVTDITKNRLLEPEVSRVVAEHERYGADRLTAVYLDERVALLELSVGSTTQ